MQLDHIPAAFASETVKLNIKVTSGETKAFNLSYEIEAIKAKSRWTQAVTSIGTDLSQQVALPDQPEDTFDERLPPQDLGTVTPGKPMTTQITLRYAEAGEYQLQVTLHADLPEDPADKVNTVISQASTISISIPFVADNRLQYEHSATPFVSLLSPERLKPDFFEKMCEASVYTIISQMTHVDLILYNIEYKHTVSNMVISVLHIADYLSAYRIQSTPSWPIRLYLSANFRTVCQTCAECRLPLAHTLYLLRLGS